MRAFVPLLTGEIQRLARYKVWGASVLVSLIWVLTLYLADVADVSPIFVVLLFFDATLMSMLLVGVTMFFEKQEGTIKSLLVSPIERREYVGAKTLGNSLLNVQTLVILYAYAWAFRAIDLNVGVLLAAVIVVGFFHALLGFVLMYRSRDFTDLLTGVLVYSFVLTIPVVLDQVGLIQHRVLEGLMYLLPTKASMTLISAASESFPAWEMVYAAGYLLVGSGVLFFWVLKGFDAFAVRESGA